MATLFNDLIMQTEDEREYEHLQQRKILEHHEMLSLSSSFYFNF